MNRSPSTTIKPTKPQGILPPVGDRRSAFQSVMAAGREAFPQMDGLTYIDAGRAYFQKIGDATVYSVAISADEAAALGYNPDHAKL